MRSFVSFSEVVAQAGSFSVSEIITVSGIEYTVYNVMFGKTGLKAWASVQLGVYVSKPADVVEKELAPFGFKGLVAPSIMADIVDIKASAFNPNLSMMIFNPKTASLAF